MAIDRLFSRSVALPSIVFVFAGDAWSRNWCILYIEEKIANREEKIVIRSKKGKGDNEEKRKGLLPELNHYQN